MRKAFSVLLALALVFALLPAVPAQALTYYSFSVAGVDVTYLNADDILGDGVFSYDYASNTLTVNGNCTYKGSVIYNNRNNLTVFIKRDCTLKSEGDQVIEARQSLTITGPGKLTISSDKSCFSISNNATVTLDRANVEAKAGTVFFSPTGEAKLTVRSSYLHAAGSAAAIYHVYYTFEGCRITAPSDAVVGYKESFLKDKNKNYVKEVTIEPTSYLIRVGGKDVTKDNAKDILGNGRLSYDPVSNVLSVKGSSSFKGTTGIYLARSDVTIRVERDSTLTADTEHVIEAYGVFTLTGPGRLTLKSGQSSALYLYNNMTLTDADLTCEGDGGFGIIGANSENGKVRNSVVTINNSRLAARGKNGAVVYLDRLLLNGCRIAEPSGGKFVDVSSYYQGAIRTAKGEMAAYAEILPIRYDLHIAGQEVNDLNRDDVLGDGVFSFDPETNTLTVSGICNYEDNIIVNGIDGLTLCVEKDARLDTGKTAISTSGDILISGPGTLNILGFSSCINASQNAAVTIRDARINAVGTYIFKGSASGSNRLSVINSSVQAAAITAAVTDFKGGIEIKDCTLTAPTGGSVKDGSVVGQNGRPAANVTFAAGSPAAQPDNPSTGSQTPQLENPFTDISPDDYFYDAVLWAYYADPQVTAGISKTKFGPGSTVTRGQAVTFLWRAVGCPEPTATVNPFVDVKESDYYYKPVLWAVEKGITVGTNATHFSPKGTCSTAHILTFLYRAMGIGDNGWYKEAEAWARNDGLLDGLDLVVDQKTMCPRADVVLFIYREMNKTAEPEEEWIAVEWPDT